MKHIQLPAFMILVSSNLNWHDRAMSTNTTTSADYEAQHQRVVKQSARLAEIRMKSGFTRAARMRGSLTEEQLDLDADEWISGKLRLDEPSPLASRPRLSRFYRRRKTGAWPAAQLLRVRAGAKFWLRRFNVTLLERDGCYYFLQGPAPAEWNDDVCYGVCSERFVRVRDFCNVKDVTEDTPETIYILCIIIACIIKCDIKLVDDDEARHLVTTFKHIFEDLLQLPLVLDNLDGCCFAITHMVHARQMISGVDLLDYTKWNPALCNILRESRTSNFLKHNYANADYPKILDIVRSISITDKMIFDNNRPLRTRPAIPGIDLIEWEDTELDYENTEDLTDCDNWDFAE